MKKNYYSLFIIVFVIIQGCSLLKPPFVFISSETTIIQYFEDENVCLIIGKNIINVSDTSWIAHWCEEPIEQAKFCYINIDDSLSILVSNKILPDTIIEQTVNDTLYQVYRYIPYPCCTCNYEIQKSIWGNNIFRPIYYFEIFVLNNLIKKIRAVYCYS